MEGETQRFNGWLHNFAVFTASATFCLLIAGALVTSNDAGLAVPDWPLSYGTWMPPMVGGIFYEHSHRLIATLVGALTTMLTLWLLLREPRRWARWLGLAALGAVATQGILGGLTVLYLLPWPISTGHAALGQLFFSLIVVLAWVTRRSFFEPASRVPDPETPPLRWLAAASGFLVVVQLFLGAAYRHQALGLSAHVAGAALVTLAVGWTSVRVIRRQGNQAVVRRAAWLAGGLLILQLCLGLASFLALGLTAQAPQPMPLAVGFTVAHVATGALLLATTVVLAIESHRRTVQPSSVLAVGVETQNAIL
jgi:cytochrome c oxidase assembly protein subunit 15